MRIAKYACCILLLCYSVLGYCETRQFTKIWGGAVITGPLSSDRKIQYYFQPRLNLIDDKYKFHSAFAFIGPGYAFTPAVTAWLLYGYDVTQSTSGHIHHIETIREQANWTLFHNDRLTVVSTSRLDERKQTTDPTWAFRIRQMITLRLPFKSWESHSLVLFDELFFNINHPSWINSNTFLEQNRTFVGIGTQFTPQTSLDLGYLNQYQMRIPNDLKSNVLFAQLNVAC